MTVSEGPEGPARNDVPLVAIGASAGGLEPLEQFFNAVPDEPGIAYVVVQHLSPDYRSMMNELLARKSNLPIHHIDDGMQVRANTVYLNRPNMYVELEGDTFRTSGYQPGADLPHLPIDRFFTSLSSRDWNRTVAIVLSGSGSDGSHGAQILHEAGAAVLVQSVKEASFPSMPKAVMISGSVDRVLDAKDMPSAIQSIFTYGKKNVSQTPEVYGDGIQRILKQLEDRHKVDFGNYKAGNVTRRIVRRLHLRGYGSLDEYAKILSESDEALNELFYDMLIGVTEFYRDTDAIKALREGVLDKLAADTEQSVPIKIWVPGCASGEEVYTIAIELSEALSAAGSDRRFRIIGTDIHAGSIETASRGAYSEQKIAKMPKDLRERYFSQVGDQFVVDPVLRQKVIFSMHDLTNDPPFMNLDLVSCRNLMIYLEDEPQANVISMFIFGLQRTGYLFLGASESLGKFKTAFEVVNARWRIFRKLSDTPSVSRALLTSRSTMGSVLDAHMPRRQVTAPRAQFYSKATEIRSREMLVRSYDTLLNRYAPSSILLTSDGMVLNWFGAAGAFVDTVNNLAEWTVQEIVHPDLHFPINVGIEKLRQGHFDTHIRRITVDLPDLGPQDCLVEIEVLDDLSGTWLLLAKIDIQSEYARPSDTVEHAPALPAPPLATEDETVLTARIHNLERDLRLTEETLQHVTERLEASGEELQASNEELQASNEELQASNEELQSSNEELHAVNEELVSVSSEHERKIELLSELKDNTEIILRMLDTGIIVLDETDCIKRFSQLIERDFLLQEHDIARSIHTVGPRLDFADLVEMTAQIRETGTPILRSGTHSGRPLDVEVRRITSNHSSEEAPGTIILFRWH